MGTRRATPARRRGTGATHTVAKVLVGSLVALAVVTGVGVTLVYRQLDSNIGRIELGPLPDRPDPGPSGALNVLVLGSDSRQGQGNGLDQESGGGSDTTILLHLSADRTGAYGVSIPRDSVVDRPACVTDRGTEPAEDGALWNAAFNVGGAGCTLQQFEALTGIRADNIVVVDFSGFKKMVDAVGGVEICTPDAIDDEKSGLVLDAGTQTISGDQALAYVRTRESVGDGSDLGRIKRQQAFVAAMAAKAVSGKVLANPVRLYSLLKAVTKSVDTDFDSLADLAGLANQFQGVGLQRIQFVTVPVADAPDDPAHVVWTDEAQDLWTKILADAPLGKLREGAITAADPAGSDPGATPSTSPSTSPSSPAPSAPSAGLDADERERVGLCS